MSSMPMGHDRSRPKPREEDDDEEDDPVEKAIKKTGCLELHYQVQECMADHRDWRKCQNEVNTFRKCMTDYHKAQAQSAAKK